MSTDKTSKKANIDWDLLLDPKNEDERSELYLDDIEAISRDFVLEIQTALEQEMKVLIVEAKKRADVTLEVLYVLAQASFGKMPCSTLERNVDQRADCCGQRATDNDDG